MVTDSIDFYYFSGTGNTFLVVDEMRKVFEEHGKTVGLHRLEHADPQTVNTQHAIGLGFPVALQGTYPFVWEFIRSLPVAKGTPIFMVDTLQMYSGGVVGPIKKIVQHKGYMPIGAREITMPNNFFPKIIHEEKNAARQQQGLKQAALYAHAILVRSSTWKRIPLLSDLMGIISQHPRAWNLVRQRYRFVVKQEKCTRCELCVKLCPVRNIVMDDVPDYHESCILCMRCIMFCPKEAISLDPDRTYCRYHAVNAAKLLHPPNNRSAE